MLRSSLVTRALIMGLLVSPIAATVLQAQPPVAWALGCGPANDGETTPIGGVIHECKFDGGGWAWVPA